jgi:hypothetical protein
MKYEKRYDMNSVHGRNEAVKDFEEYAGERRAELLRNGIRNGEIETMAQFRLLASFCGVRGAPVVAFAERNGLYE